MTPYRQELEKYRDIDEDKILQELSPEELAQLDEELAEMDPEPFVPMPNVPLSPCPQGSCLSPSVPLSPGKPFVPKAAAPALPREEQVTLEPELEEALANATEAEMCDIAAILGMYTLMSNKQYYDAICSGNICNTEGINSVVQPDRYRPVPDEPPNPTDVAETLRRLQDNDPELRDVNLNNIKDIPVPTLEAICQAIQTNTHVRSLSLVATRSNDLVANVSPPAWGCDSDTDRVPNDVPAVPAPGGHGGDGAVTVTLTVSPTMSPQCQRLGDTVEMAMAATLEQCPSLLRFGYTFTLQGPRARAAAALTRNNELRECPQGP
ncbi:TMOD4 protein, partial [Calcarius ornatus]|nr:TMOD4 protein [Calcarius ornatus]